MVVDKSAKRTRLVAEGFVPDLSIEGSTFDAGCQLGSAWTEALQIDASRLPPSARPWWKQRSHSRLIARHAPHLPDLYRGMARGAKLSEDQIAVYPVVEEAGCTSFGIAPQATLDGKPMSGQTKDVSLSRGAQFVVLRLKLTDVKASALTLTYPGWLYGHGFVTGGCALFRNSLFTGKAGGDLPYDVWGLLALHCKRVDQVMKLTRDHLVDESFHVTVADELGGVVGIENGPGGPVFLEPKRDIYVHANAVLTSKRLLKFERDEPPFTRADSRVRTSCLRRQLERNRGQLTSQLVCAALADHEGYPRSICRHQSPQAVTSATVIAEPTRGRLHVVRGPVCQNWPRTVYL